MKYLEPILDKDVCASAVADKALELYKIMKSYGELRISSGHLKHDYESSKQKGGGIKKSSSFMWSIKSMAQTRLYIP